MSFSQKYPSNSTSVFVVEAIQAPTLYWTPVLERTYSIYWTDDLNQPFVRIAFGLTSGSYTDTQHSDYHANYYRIQVELE